MRKLAIRESRVSLKMSRLMLLKVFFAVFSLRERFLALGCKLFKFDAENKEECASLKRIVKEQNYNFQDEITVSPKHLPEYEKKVKMFLEEHIHDDPEARACLEGSGYFDVRDKNDKWIRILIEKGDLLIVPAGIYHRNGKNHNFKYL